MCKWLCLFRQRSLWVALFSLLVALATIGAPPLASAQTVIPLPVKQLSAGMHVIRAEVASNYETRARGLMYRKELAPNAGMLFVFVEPGIQCFWMRNTLIPLSIAFMSDDGTITNIADMTPMTENTHCSSVPVRLALEMEQGWFTKRGITAGKKIGGLQ
ncbi:DUF192 domain-containing protein [Alcaligenaceae bacterium LF4-65]|jgi:uncharacterized protein|uniref:DUF192 domain-containing protein n=1 Tax=Zwartia hollandica TaxID=324606 RepID=A0A953T0P6_9BURK|nr:DUF192 domain-containing protein [Zwartia hollandica]MBZ1349353.1 DUF192 domain-containing protein [Zwartia hollandica]